MCMQVQIINILLKTPILALVLIALTQAATRAKHIIHCQ